MSQHVHPFEVMVLLLIMRHEMTVTTLMVKAEMMSVMESIEDGIVRQMALQLMSVTLSLWMEFT